MKVLSVIVVTLLLGVSTFVAADDQSRTKPTTQVCTLKVSGMTCAGCEAAVKIAARSIDGVKDVKASYAKENAEVTYDPSKRKSPVTTPTAPRSPPPSLASRRPEAETHRWSQSQDLDARPRDQVVDLSKSTVCPVLGTQDRDACVRTPFALSDEERGKHCANEKHCANDPEPTMLHDLSSQELDTQFGIAREFNRRLLTHHATPDSVECESHDAPATMRRRSRRPRAIPPTGRSARGRVPRLGPRDARELANPLRSDPAHRIQQAVGRAGVLQVVRNLVAQGSARKQMLGIAA